LIHLSNTAGIGFVRTRHVCGLVSITTLGSLENPWSPSLARSTDQCVRVHGDDFKSSLLQIPE